MPSLYWQTVENILRHYHLHFSGLVTHPGKLSWEVQSDWFGIALWPFGIKVKQKDWMQYKLTKITCRLVVINLASTFLLGLQALIHYIVCPVRCWADWQTAEQRLFLPMFAGQEGNKDNNNNATKNICFPSWKTGLTKGSRPNPLDFDLNKDCTHATGTLIKCLRVSEDGPWRTFR